ncbi:MAG: hypothetical protein ACOCV1_05385 [Bacillota bacterium]
MKNSFIILLLFLLLSCKKEEKKEVVITRVYIGSLEEKINREQEEIRKYYELKREKLILENKITSITLEMKTLIH